MHQSSVPSKITPLYFFFSSNIIYFGQRIQLKNIFFRFSRCYSKDLSNSCQFWNDKPNSSSNFALFFIVMTYNSSVSFKLKHFQLWTKGSHKSPNFDIFKWSGEKLPNSPCHFPNHKSVFLQIFHHSSVSWKITPLHLF